MMLGLKHGGYFCTLELFCWISCFQFWTGSTAADVKVEYSGHAVLRLHPNGPSDYRLLWELSQKPYLDLELWGEPLRNHSLDIRVAPHAYMYVIRCLTHHRIHWELKISDIQRLIDAQLSPDGADHLRKRRSTKGKRGGKKEARLRKKRERQRQRLLLKLNKRNAQNGHTAKGTLVGYYARYREIRLWMKYLKSLYSIATVVEIGRTSENRALELLKISTNPDGPSNKSAIWIDGGIHGREWISPATVIYIIEALLQGYRKDPYTTLLVDTFDWYLLPVANPDGYEYSHTVDRLWRKTRSRPRYDSTSRCFGVDLNRNFGYQWKGHCDRNWLAMCGSSHPCQNTYAGESAFSEPEAKAIALKIISERHHIKLYLSLHSYSQLWLTPWGYTNDPPPDKYELMHIAQKGLDALRNTFGTHYKAGSPANILYAAGGGSYDWVKGVAGVKYSYTIELRDKGRYGFMLPREYIYPVGEEMWNAVKVIAQELSRIV